MRLHAARLLLGDAATEKDSAVSLWKEGGKHAEVSVRHLNDGVLMASAWQVARRVWATSDRRPTSNDVGFVAVVLHAMARGTS